ncbi:MAG TPA: hypothetical protein VLA72_18660 [Anaerolineales bacterium]|nr:hypothetical protein [Anaerolineales bacterium]
MGKFFKLPDYNSGDLNVSARLNYYLGAGLVLFSLLFVTLVQFIAPELSG